MEKDNDEIIPMREAAKILHISYSSMVQLIKKKGVLKIPHSRIGDRIKFKRKDVEDYFQKTFAYTEDESDKEG